MSIPQIFQNNVVTGYISKSKLIGNPSISAKFCYSAKKNSVVPTNLSDFKNLDDEVTSLEKILKGEGRARIYDLES